MADAINPAPSIKVPRPVVEAVMAYLAQCPWQQVHGLMGELLRLHQEAQAEAE